jgi:hypothetical protein
VSDFSPACAETESSLPHYLSFTVVAQQLGLHRTTVWRWFRYGHRGVHLQAVKLPGGWATTSEAVEHFVQELTSQAGHERHPSTPRQEERRQAQVEEQLRSRFGIGGKGVADA